MPISILSNSTPGTSSESGAPATAQIDAEHELSTHVPLRLASGTTVPAIVPQAEEAAAPAPKSIPEPEETVIKEEEKSEEPTPVHTEAEGEREVEAPKEAVVAPAEVEGNEAPVAMPEPELAPPTEPVSVEEPESAPAREPEVAAAPEEPIAMPEPEHVPEAKTEVAAIPAPVAEPTPQVGTKAAVPEPTPAAAPAPAVEPTPEPGPPAVNGHTKSVSTSTAPSSLPATIARKASRKFSFTGHGKDKSGNSSPTGSSRFSSGQKREKRHSLLGKLKEIFTDKGKKEKGESKA